MTIPDALRSWLLARDPNRPDPYGHDEAMRQQRVAAIEADRPLPLLTTEALLRLRGPKIPE